MDEKLYGQPVFENDITIYIYRTKYSKLYFVFSSYQVAQIWEKDYDIPHIENILILYYVMETNSELNFL